MIKRFTIEIDVPKDLRRDGEEWVETYFPDSYVRDSVENMVGDVIYRLQSHPLEPDNYEFNSACTLRKVRKPDGGDKGLTSGSL